MTLPPSPWIVRRAPRDRAALRLFLLPHAGAGAVIYRDWPAAFPDAIDVCAIEPPGRFARRHEPQPKDAVQFGRDLARAIAPYLDRPFAFFGYSLGALMAFECARTLRREHGAEPSYLIAAAHKAPQLRPRARPISREPSAAFVAEVERRYGPLEPMIRNDPEMLALVIEMMRVDLGMVENYRYVEEPRLNCPILALGGTEDSSVNSEELAAWSQQTSMAFRSHALPGGHFFLRSVPDELRRLVCESLLPYTRATAV